MVATTNEILDEPTRRNLYYEVSSVRGRDSFKSMGRSPRVPWPSQSYRRYPRMIEGGLDRILACTPRTDFVTLGLSWHFMGGRYVFLCEWPCRSRPSFCCAVDARGAVMIDVVINSQVGASPPSFSYLSFPLIHLPQP